MAKISLTARERFALYSLLNHSSVAAGRAAQRKLDRVWVAINLDEIDTAVQRKPQSGAEAFDHVKRAEYELTSDERDVLIDYTELGMIGWAVRLLYPVGGLLIKSRDGDEAAK